MHIFAAGAHALQYTRSNFFVLTIQVLPSLVPFRGIIVMFFLLSSSGMLGWDCMISVGSHYWEPFWRTIAVAAFHHCFFLFLLFLVLSSICFPPTFFGGGGEGRGEATPMDCREHHGWLCHPIYCCPQNFLCAIPFQRSSLWDFALSRRFCSR